MNILIELFTVFFKLGAFTIGGGIAMLPLLQNTLINEKKWFTKEEFMDIVAVCQSLPGVVAINMATYVGYKKKGLIGSVVSTFGVTIPSFTMILIIARFITSLGDNGVLMGAMAGLRAAALGMVVVALIQLMPAAIKNKWAMLAAVVAFVLIAVLKVNTAYVILLFAVLGITVTFAGSRKMAAAAESDGGAENAEAGEGGESE
jgi:chromate transporter